MWHRFLLRYCLYPRWECIACPRAPCFSISFFPHFYFEIANEGRWTAFLRLCTRSRFSFFFVLYPHLFQSIQMYNVNGTNPCRRMFKHTKNLCSNKMGLIFILYFYNFTIRHFNSHKAHDRYARVMLYMLQKVYQVNYSWVAIHVVHTEMRRFTFMIQNWSFDFAWRE